MPNECPPPTLHLPVGDAQEGPAPEISFVLPAMNEALTIGECLDWCFEGLAKAGVTGEVLIIDSSNDGTAEIALAKGARVLHTGPRGLGQAYIDALPYIRGRYVVMGDCDCTYDYRALGPFVEKFREGFEFVMGSRFKGSIEDGAMPPHHRYFGTPLTTWILNRIFSSRFSDIHCGMRGLSLEAMKRMNIVSTSWEYASEMVIKSVHMGLRTAEVPVHFYKDRNGRESHHKRMGWWSPWAAGWINLKAMFIYGANFFLSTPGKVLLASGLLLVLPLALGPITLGPITFSVFWMLLGMVFSILGLQCVFIGILSQLFFDYEGSQARQWIQAFRYNRIVIPSILIFLVGLVWEGAFFRSYVHQGFTLALTNQIHGVHRAIFGLFLMIVGFMTFVFTLIFNGYILSLKSRVHHEGNIL